MQENFRSNNIKKVSAVLLVVLFCACVFASFLCAIVLPFRKDVASAASNAAIASGSSDVPTYVDGAMRGVYIDTSSFTSVPFVDLTSDTEIYGFYYEVSVFKVCDDFFLDIVSGSDSFFNGGSLVFSPYGSNGNNIRLRVPSSEGLSPICINLQISSSSFPLLYSLNCFTSPLPFTFSSTAISDIDAHSDYFQDYWYAITEPFDSGEKWSPSAFSSTFVTMALSPSSYVYVNLSSYPIIPDYSVFVNANGVYGCEIFDTYTSDGSATGFYGRVNTGWQYEPKFSGVGVSAKFSHWVVSLYVGFSLVYSCKVTPPEGSTGDASGFNNGLISDQTWHVSRSFDFGSLPIYQYSSTNAGYMHILKSTSNVSSWQFGSKGWSNYIALFDLRNGFDKETSGLYNAGVADGQGNLEQAKQDSYNSGFSEGSSSGYNKGYSDGINDSGEYSFVSLIGAVFDAPISAFKGLLNFEVLGVNMSSFVISMLTLSVIIIIIKICLGGK